MDGPRSLRVRLDGDPRPDVRQQDVPAGRWLSVKEIAADLSVSIHTAYKWSARGEPWFPRTIRLHNGDLRVRRDWYELWLARMEGGEEQ
jgi:hypothetical protein